MSYVNDRGLQIYNDQREELELDNFNLLYVALTRAEEQLYIITDKKLSTKGEENTSFYSGVFINYLKQKNLWNEDELEFYFGEKERVSRRLEEKSISEIHQKFISTPWQEHNIHLLASASKLWNTVQGEAIDYGNLLHEIMANIIIEKDIEQIVLKYEQQGILDEIQTKQIEESINKVVYHPELKKYFSDDVVVFNEREIVAQDNQIIIPDRLVFNSKNDVVIIDYKTGKPSKSYHQQLLKYEQVLKLMNFNVIKKLLIYINEEIDVVEV